MNAPVRRRTTDVASLLLFAVAVPASLLLVAVALPASQTAPTFTRTMLQDQPLSAKDRHGVMSRSEFQPGAVSGRHTHPGEELSYILEGTLELTVEGKPVQRYKAGDVVFVPANTVHDAKNVGTGPLKVLATYVLETGKPLATSVK